MKTKEKIEKLDAFIKIYDKIAVAYSGGVDSSYLAKKVFDKA